MVYAIKNNSTDGYYTGWIENKKILFTKSAQEVKTWKDEREAVDSLKGILKADLFDGNKHSLEVVPLA
jgi:hypothetical protein